MLQRDDFVSFILEGPKAKSRAKADVDTGPTLPGEFADFGFSSEETREETETDLSFARQLMEASGFGSAEYLERSEVILGNDPAARYLPEKVFYWPKKDNRPYQTLLFELEQPGRQLLKAPLFKTLEGQEILEDAISRLVQMSLRGFEKGGEKRTAAVKSGKQNETLCIVSVQDDRLESDKPLHLVCLGTRSEKLSSLETYHIREEARLWERQLAVVHLSRLYDRHFSKLDGEKWQDSFITGEERKLAQNLMDECVKKKPEKSTIQKCVVNLLEEIAKTFGLRKKPGGKTRLTAFQLPKDHDIGIDPESREKQGGQNPFEGMILRDEKSRLLGYIIYCLDQNKDASKLRKYLAHHNRFHNVLVIYPDGTEAVLELWQGMKMLEGKLTKQGSAFEGEGKVVNLLSRFFVVSKAKVRNPAELAQELAYRARYLRRLAAKQLEEETDSGLLRFLYNAFKKSLIHNQTEEQFADSYAQTLTYGLLSARWISKDLFASKLERFTREKALEHFPPSSPFLRDFFRAVLKTHSAFKLSWLLDDIADLLDRTDIGLVFRVGEMENNEFIRDPVIHFYEPFLAAYDAKMKKNRGVYYTPQPIVSFIVRSIDEILRKDFGLENGLADTATWGEMSARFQGLKIPKGTKASDPFVRILDLSTGTGTFLMEVIDVIYRTMTSKWKAEGNNQQKVTQLWLEYVPKNLFPRLFGFEFMMAPYAIAHMKLGLKLKQTGYDFKAGQRLQVYLTNTLDRDTECVDNLFAEFLTEEAKAASTIKNEAAISVVIGNPPYSVNSANKNSDIDVELYVYKENLDDERNLKPLNDDYVKFLRYAHMKILSAGIGLIGMITNHSFASARLFRSMRQSILADFSRVFFLDLHGQDSRDPDMAADENVFPEIQQGVGISLLSLSNKSKRETIAKVENRELIGSRISKYKWLAEHTVLLSKWKTVYPQTPFYSFFSVNLDLSHEYHSFIPVVDLFEVENVGYQTHRDDFVIDFEKKSLEDRFKAFQSAPSDETSLSQKFGISSTNEWPLLKAHSRAKSDKKLLSHLLPTLYRPFDIRFICYVPYLIDRDRIALMKHFFIENLGLLTSKVFNEHQFTSVFVTRLITESKAADRTRGSHVFPLYLNQSALLKKGSDRVGPTLNLSKVSKGLSPQALKYSKQTSKKQRPNDPILSEDVFYYIYSILHSPVYRSRYVTFLKTDFPKIPIIENMNLFHCLCSLGADLVALHLLEDDYEAASWKDDKGPLSLNITEFVSDGICEVVSGHPKYKDGKVYINKKCYFKGVPEPVWKFHIGGYHVCHKWLKDRAPKGGKNPSGGKVLTEQDIAHYQKIIVAINETIRLMAEIDDVIERHGGWPDAFVTKNGDN